MRCSAVTAVLLLGAATLVAASVAADVLNPLTGDLTEDSALRQLSIAEQHVLNATPEQGVPKLETLLATRPDWSRGEVVKLQLAIAYFKTATYSKPSFLDLNRCLTRCIHLCRELSGPGQENPLTAAWAKTYFGGALEALGQTQEAMRLYREVDSYIPVLTDLGPVLDARHRAADHFLRTTKFDPAHPDHPEILSFDSEDKEAWAWAHGALCARRAWGGDVEAAYREYDELV